MTKYPFKTGDLVAMIPSGRKGGVLTVGQFGSGVSALVKWADGDGQDYVPIEQLKKTLLPINGGKDPDT